MIHKKTLKLSIILSILCYMIIANWNIVFAGTLSSDINGINESKYPGVKSLITNLQKKHSNYKFQVYYTGIDWTEAITMEYQGHGSSPKNLFSLSKNYKGKWYCPICGSRTYDTGWYCASVDAIKYMMDPRNSLDETSVYQFKNLEKADVSAENIQTTINKRYSSYSYINNSTAINAIINASQKNNLNAYSILAKIVNEQGKGSSPLVQGTGYNGQYAGYYNFFNVGAYGNGESTVMRNGLKYAKNKGWNSVEKSILGGSEYYKSSYIGKGQNTLYYQRFNVVYQTSLFSHQYQQDIMGAQTSATLLKNYYSDTSALSNVEHTFIIPLYENMPSQACARPSTEENSKLEYEDATVLVNKATVKASPKSSRIISYLNINEKVKVLERAQSPASDGKYWDVIVTNTDGTYGYIERSQISQQYEMPDYAFDYKYYADNNSDIKSAYGYDEFKLKQHFMNYGLKEGRVSSPTFNVAYYLENNIDLKTAYGKDYVKAYEHFIKYGCNELRKSSPEYDGFFYKYYYSSNNNLSGVSLMEHYIKTGRKAGWLGGLDPYIENILFDIEIYTFVNPDIKAAYGNDNQKIRIHWLKYGIAEGRIASLVYDASIYYVLNSDVQKVFGNNKRLLFEHFVRNGINEGRKANLTFDVLYYLSSNSDVKKAYGNNYKLAYYHFVNYGIREGRNTSFIFNVRGYVDYNIDIKKAYSSNYKLSLLHFMRYGIYEKRRTSTTFNINKYMAYSDLKKAYGNDYKSYYIHYLLYGCKEGRKTV